MKAAAEALEEFGVEFEADVVSAHRMPEEMIAYGKAAAGRGLKVIIAGAGGAAHLPGMLASVTPLPVIGVPVPLQYLDGMDSLLSIVQMPAGVPVATVGVGQRQERRPARRTHPGGVRRRPAQEGRGVPGEAGRVRPGEGQGRPRRHPAEDRLLSPPASPCSCANTTICTRSRRSSLRRMLPTWVFTVDSLTKIDSAISVFDRPRATAASTSRSLSVSVVVPRRQRRRARNSPDSSVLRSSGASTALPACTVRIASASIAGVASLSRNPLAPWRIASRPGRRG